MFLVCRFKPLSVHMMIFVKQKESQHYLTSWSSMMRTWCWFPCLNTAVISSRVKGQRSEKLWVLFYRPAKKFSVPVMMHHLKIQTHLDFFSPPKNVSEHFFIFTLSPLQFPSQLPLQIFLALLHLRVILDSSLPISNKVISVFLPDIFYIYVLIYSQCYHFISGPDYLTLRQLESFCFHLAHHHGRRTFLKLLSFAI